jgi:uncharacterized protein (TIGR02679 family)
VTEPSATCEWCSGYCADVDLTAVLGEHLDWFWRQLADAADRRGDVDLVTGTTTIKAPANPAERAAALGLLAGRTPASGQTIRINLADLTARIRIHHPGLTPGMVAAHATRRSLGQRARDDAKRRDALEQLRQHAIDTFAAVPEAAPFRPDMRSVWPILRRAGWVARLIATDYAVQLIDQAAAIIAALPPDGQRRDRRRLADAVTRFPHALDEGMLPGLVLAILIGADAIPAGMPNRAAWAAVGIDYDDLTGGLLALGIYPARWSLPADTAVTIPPRELSRCRWPTPPHPNACVYVTENPSVVAAAADLAEMLPVTQPTIRLLCTVGTPSAREIDAIARLATTGWRVAVRADFDEAGLQHVDAMLKAVATARPWRMGATDYLASLAGTSSADQARLRGRTIPATPWDPQLQLTMSERGLAAYEETLIDVLLDGLTVE